MTIDDSGLERIRAGQRRRWDSTTPAQRKAQMGKARFRADSRWERQADPRREMTPEDRAIAGARLRDAYYRDLLGDLPT